MGSRALARAGTAIAALVFVALTTGCKSSGSEGCWIFFVNGDNDEDLTVEDLVTEFEDQPQAEERTLSDEAWDLSIDLGQEGNDLACKDGRGAGGDALLGYLPPNGGAGSADFAFDGDLGFLVDVHVFDAGLPDSAEGKAKAASAFRLQEQEGSPGQPVKLTVALQTNEIAIVTLDGLTAQDIGDVQVSFKPHTGIPNPDGGTPGADGGPDAGNAGQQVIFFTYDDDTTLKEIRYVRVSRFDPLAVGEMKVALSSPSTNYDFAVQSYDQQYLYVIAYDEPWAWDKGRLACYRVVEDASAVDGVRFDLVKKLDEYAAHVDVALDSGRADPHFIFFERKQQDQTQIAFAGAEIDTPSPVTAPPDETPTDFVGLQWALHPVFGGQGQVLFTANCTGDPMACTDTRQNYRFSWTTDAPAIGLLHTDQRLSPRHLVEPEVSRDGRYLASGRITNLCADRSPDCEITTHCAPYCLYDMQADSFVTSPTYIWGDFSWDSQYLLYQDASQGRRIGVWKIDSGDVNGTQWVTQKGPYFTEHPSYGQLP